jgi:predicted phosphodiesterase
MGSVRLHVISDLHLERAGFDAPPVDADVLVAAGDIARGTDGVAWLAEAAAGRPAIYVAGNHEFYGHALPALVDDLRAAAAGTTVHVLENEEVVLDGVRFLGCTLWSDFDFSGPEQRAASMGVCARVVNDYAHIAYEPEGRTLRPADTRTRHVASRHWLSRRLAAGHDGPTVVVTHHQPLIRTRPTEPMYQAIAGAFASDLTDLMGGDRAGLWIYGHTHRVADLDVGGTRVISNPRGYPHEAVEGFDPALVVAL